MLRLKITAAIAAIFVVAVIAATAPAGAGTAFLALAIPLVALAIMAGAIALFPWGIQKAFGRRSGKWAAVGAALVLASAIPYWAYLWQTECADCVKCYVDGDRFVDNDATCRGLFFGLPMICALVVLGILSLYVSAARLSRRYGWTTSLQKGA